MSDRPISLLVSSQAMKEEKPQVLCWSAGSGGHLLQAWKQVRDTQETIQRGREETFLVTLRGARLIRHLCPVLRHVTFLLLQCRSGFCVHSPTNLLLSVALVTHMHRPSPFCRFRPVLRLDPGGSPLLRCSLRHTHSSVFPQVLLLAQAELPGHPGPESCQPSSLSVCWSTPLYPISQ